MGRFVALLLSSALLAVSAGSSLGAVHRIPGCHAADLSATFAEVPRSVGGGLVAYALALRNISNSACTLAFSEVRLLDQQGQGLATTVTASPQAAFGSTVVLRPGQSGVQTAQLSATFPGQGEPTKGPCEPLAYRIQVKFGPATKSLQAQVEPPTPVCSNGMLIFGPVTRAA